uniref:Uncharacterized protein n=1 Tax=Arundo donax TaxID=35708 RepID=A0A0A8ZQL5_ARUDO
MCYLDKFYQLFVQCVVGVPSQLCWEWLLLNKHCKL